MIFIGKVRSNVFKILSILFTFWNWSNLYIMHVNITLCRTCSKKSYKFYVYLTMIWVTVCCTFCWILLICLVLLQFCSKSWAQFLSQWPLTPCLYAWKQSTKFWDRVLEYSIAYYGMCARSLCKNLFRIHQVFAIYRVSQKSACHMKNYCSLNTKATMLCNIFLNS